MRLRGLVIATVVLVAAALVAWFVMRQPSAVELVSGSGSNAGSSTSSSSSSTGRPTRPGSGAASGSGTSPGIDCTRTAGDAARVDDATITVARLCDQLAKLGGVTAAGGDRKQARLILDRLIDATLVTRALEQQRASVSDAEVQAALVELQRKQQPSSSDAALLAEQLRERLEVQKLAGLKGTLAVTEADVDGEIASGAPGIDRGQGVRVDAWMVRVRPGAEAKDWEAAKKPADEFAAAVKTTAPETAARTPVARLPPFVVSENGVEPALESAATSLAKGQWSDAIKTKSGWIVVRPIEQVAGVTLDDKAFRARVRKALETKKLGLARQRLLEELRAAARIEILIDLQDVPAKP